MKKNLLFCTLCICSLLAFAQSPPTSVPETPQYLNVTKKYIEYIPGTLPILISAPHGGKIVANELLTRSGCGTNEEDNNTDILIREIQKQCYAQMGGYPHIIINNLRRSKLDPNRIRSVAICNDTPTATNDAGPYFDAYHGFIDTAIAQIVADYGKGIAIDLHGQSHNPERIDVGYNIQYTTLSSTLSNTINYSTIENLKNNNLQNLSLEELVRGSQSLGQLFQTTDGAYYNSTRTPCSSDSGRTVGYRATPSNYTTGCDDRYPGSEYFEGDYYSNVRHGSGDPSTSSSLVGGGSLNGGGGTIDGMMTEVNRRVRDLGSVYSGTSSYNRTDTQQPRLYYFAQDYATVIVDYIDVHYNDFSEYDYSASSYDVTDADPTPTLTDGVSGGIYLSTPVGLVVDPNTGIIDVSASIVGNYTVTYSVGPASASSAPNRYYNVSRSIEITDNTLSIQGQEYLSVKLYPNPTTGVVNIESNMQFSELKVYSILGQQVMSKPINTNQSSINLSELKAGSYLMTFFIDGQSVGSKLIVKH